MAGEKKIGDIYMELHAKLDALKAELAQAEAVAKAGGAKIGAALNAGVSGATRNNPTDGNTFGASVADMGIVDQKASSFLDKVKQINSHWGGVARLITRSIGLIGLAAGAAYGLVKLIGEWHEKQLAVNAAISKGVADMDSAIAKSRATLLHEQAKAYAEGSDAQLKARREAIALEAQEEQRAIYANAEAKYQAEVKNGTASARLTKTIFNERDQLSADSAAKYEAMDRQVVAETAKARNAAMEEEDRLRTAREEAAKKLEEDNWNKIIEYRKELQRKIDEQHKQALEDEKRIVEEITRAREETARAVASLSSSLGNDRQLNMLSNLLTEVSAIARSSQDAVSLSSL